LILNLICGKYEWSGLDFVIKNYDRLSASTSASSRKKVKCFKYAKPQTVTESSLNGTYLRAYPSAQQLLNTRVEEFYQRKQKYNQFKLIRDSYLS
jgi:hypothetical protein